MIIVIDGYNLLKQIFPSAQKNLVQHKQTFIKQLAYYKSKKAPTIKDIIIVFDAGPSTHATRSISNGIVVLYSGIKSSADQWIINFVERTKNHEILVITRDRELKETCKSYGADWLDIEDFYNIVQNVLTTDITSKKRLFPQTENIVKYEDAEFDDDEYMINKKALDLLMEQAIPETLINSKSDIFEKESSRKKKSYTLSKKEKRIQTKLNKLR